MPELNRQQFMDLYHGTHAEAAQGIQREGLWPAEWNPSVATVAHDRATALEHAHDTADWADDAPAVVHFRVPTNEWAHRYAGESEDYGMSRAAGLRETLPARYIHDVEYPKRQPGGLYKHS